MAVDETRVTGAAGTLSGGRDRARSGHLVVVNDIRNSVVAAIDGAVVTSTGGTVEVSGAEEAVDTNVAVGGAGLRGACPSAARFPST